MTMRLSNFQYTPALAATPSCFGYLPYGAEAKVNLALIVAVVYIVCYVVMEPVVGTVGALMVAAIYLYTGHLVRIH